MYFNVCNSGSNQVLPYADDVNLIGYIRAIERNADVLLNACEDIGLPGMDCNNYRGISLLSTSYKILSNILLSRMTSCANEIIGEYRCGFRGNRSTVDHIFSIRQVLEKKWEYN